MNPFPSVSPDLFSFVMMGVFAIVNILISLLVAMAGKRKDRGFGSFFWLSFAMGFLIPALVVAALPFREDDPDRPSNKR